MDSSFIRQRCVHASIMRWSMLSIRAAPVKKTKSTLKIRVWKRRVRDHQMEIRRSAHEMSTCLRVGAMEPWCGTNSHANVILSSYVRWCVVQIRRWTLEKAAVARIDSNYELICIHRGLQIGISIKQMLICTEPIQITGKKCMKLRSALGGRIRITQLVQKDSTGTN